MLSVPVLGAGTAGAASGPMRASVVHDNDVRAARRGGVLEAAAARRPGLVESSAVRGPFAAVRGTVPNHFVRQCSILSWRCTAYRQINGPYASGVGSTYSTTWVLRWI